MKSLCATALVGIGIFYAAAASAADPEVERGKYLVTIASCNDCHTPGHFLGKPDFSRGSYSVICWYGPFPIAALIQLGGSSLSPQASRARRQPR